MEEENQRIEAEKVEADAALEEADNEPAAVEEVDTFIAPAVPILSLIEVIHDPYCNAYFCPTGNVDCIEAVMYDMPEKRNFGAIFIEGAEECTGAMRKAATERQTQMLAWLHGEYL